MPTDAVPKVSLRGTKQGEGRRVDRDGKETHGFEFWLDH